jgi:hypothetical protein
VIVTTNIVVAFIIEAFTIKMDDIYARAKAKSIYSSGGGGKSSANASSGSSGHFVTATVSWICQSVGCGTRPFGKMIGINHRKRPVNNRISDSEAAHTRISSRNPLQRHIMHVMRSVEAEAEAEAEADKNAERDDNSDSSSSSDDDDDDDDDGGEGRCRWWTRRCSCSCSCFWSRMSTSWDHRKEKRKGTGRRQWRPRALTTKAQRQWREFPVPTPNEQAELYYKMAFGSEGQGGEGSAIADWLARRDLCLAEVEIREK